MISADHWRTLREIRNAFAHDYPEAEAARVQAINLAWQSAGDLLQVADNVYNNCKQQKIDLPELERADQ